MKLSHLNIVTGTTVLKNYSLEISDGKIARIAPENTPAPQEQWALPAFVDTHIHGMGGFGPEQGTLQALLNMSAILARQGVRAFCPTLYCARPDNMAAQLRALVPALGKETGAKIIGFHLEGPFISPEKPGVMKPQDIAPANLDDFKRIYQAAQGHIAIVTLAPEVPGILPIIEFCHAHHILVQAGHTNATYAQMQEAFTRGVRRVTHWGNAMRGLHQREPGTLGAALLNPEISCEVIADGKHIHPALLSLLKQVKPLSQITAVTDSLLPTGQVKGPFFANGEEVMLQENVWKRKTDGVTAGSALTMLGAVQCLRAVGYQWHEIVACTSTNAAQLLQIPLEKLQESNPANLVIVNPCGQVIRVVFQGQGIL